MWLDDVTRQVLGIDAYLGRLAPWSDAAKKHQLMPWLPRAQWQVEYTSLCQTQSWAKQHAFESLQTPFEQLPSMDAVLRHLRAGTPLKTADLYTLKRALFYGQQIATIANPLLGLWRPIATDCHRLETLMAQIHPETAPSPRFRLSDELDQAMPNIRKALRVARRALLDHQQNLERAILSDYPDAHVDIQGAWTFSEAVHPRIAADTRLILRHGRWHLQDQTLIQLSENFELAQQEMDAIISSVLLGLSNKLSTQVDWLFDYFEALTVLDVRLAKVRLLTQVNGCWPEHAADQMFHMEQGHDPHLPQPVQTVDFSTTWAQPIVVTGPNMGGKSALLRLIGLAHWCLAYLMPVPAQVCRLVSVDSLVYIGADERSGALGDGLSAFGREVRRLVTQRADANGKICWLLDELARGTHPQEGDQLAQEIVSHLVEEGGRVICATHFSGLASVMWAEHFRIKGLDHDTLAVLPEEDASYDQMMHHLRNAMNYQPVMTAQGDGVPRDAKLVAKLLGLTWL